MNGFLGRSSVAALLVGAGVCLAGCSTNSKLTQAERVDFTNTLRTSWNFSDDEIRELQFYTHDTFTLERDLGGEARNITHGRLVVRAGHDIEIIEIPAGTPGVATKVSKGAIDICFEGACDSTLIFQYPASANYPDFSGNYVTRVNDLAGNSGSVVYDGKTYTLHPLTFLQIDAQSLRRTENRRMVPGKRLGERPTQ